MTPAALFDPEHRRKVAQLAVWGSGQRFNRQQIENRVVRILERIARKVEDESRRAQQLDSDVTR